MGKDVANANDGIIKEVERSGEGTADGTASESSDSTSTKTKRGRGRGTGDRGSGDTTAEKEIVSGLASVEKVPEPAKQKSKPKRTRTKKSQEPSVDYKQVSALIVGTSAIIAGRPGKEYWQISEQEADGVSKPLCNIIEKSEALGKMGEHTDVIVLAMGSLAIVLPRLMIGFQRKKEVKRIERTGNKTDVTVKDKQLSGETGTTDKNSGGTDRKPTPVSKTVYHDLSFLGDVSGA